MSRNFLGRGWKYPVEVDRAGGIAMSELDESIRQSLLVILGTAPGERVMRPQLRLQHPRPGLRPQQLEHRQPGRALLHRGARQVGAAHRGGRGARRRRRARIPTASTSPSSTRSARPTRRATWSTRSTSAGAMRNDPRAEARRQHVCRHRRRGDAAHPALLPGVDQPQSVGPGHHDARADGVDDRAHPLSAQPRPREELPRLPEHDRHPAALAAAGARAHHLRSRRGRGEAGHQGRHADRDRAGGRRRHHHLRDAEGADRRRRAARPLLLLLQRDVRR